MQRLVAAAVPEIDASAVTILDSRGVALTKAVDKEAEDAKGLEGKLAVKQQTEEYLTQKIAGILDKTFGPGKAIVSVDVTLNHDSLKVTREDVLPAPTQNGDPDGAVTRRKSHSRRSVKARKVAQGDGADDGNLPADLATDEIEYQHGRKIEQLISNPGSIKRLSVGVILPSNVESDKVDMLSKVIAMSVGLNSARGDALAVYPLNRAVARDTSIDQDTVAQSANHGNAKAAKTADISPINAEKPYWYLFAVAVMASVIGGLLWLAANRRFGSRRMSEEQREKTLNEIQDWLARPHHQAARTV